MLKYISKRILYMILVFLAMSVVLFFVYNLVPGDPARAEIEQYKHTLTAEQYDVLYEKTREKLGLNDKLHVRYIKWITKMLSGDLGYSSRYKKDVIAVIKEPMKTTVFINIFAVTLALGITIPLGIYSAVNKNSTKDKIIQVFTVIGYSIPSFIVGLLFIYIFAVKLGKFPVSGMGTPGFTGSGFEVFKDKMTYLFLPLMSMTVSSLGGMTRHVRAAMIDALSMDYITTARAKGVKERLVILSHAWRNALLPVITMIIGWIVSIFSGSIVIESMFGIPGIGKLLFDSLMNNDYNVALAVQMFYILLTVVSNLIIDLSYGIVDPRVRIDQ